VMLESLGGFLFLSIDRTLARLGAVVITPQ
jgi:hypothetical protein